jgi:transposase
MPQRKYKHELNRHAPQLLPARVEDYVSETNVIRGIDIYIDTLNLEQLGFTNTQLVSLAGQPSYDPSALIKLYLYGYQQGIRSSRKLERECQRNLEVIWLTSGIHPSYKTIANFRKDNVTALTQVHKDFIIVCKELSLLGSDVVAIDGSFFEADASTSSIYTQQQLESYLASIDKKIKSYQEALNQQDKREDQATTELPVEVEGLPEKLALLQQKQAEKADLLEQVKTRKGNQISTVDPDARLLKKRGKTLAGYNVQIVVESEHHLMVATHVTQEGNDSHQLKPMMDKAQSVLDSDTLVGLADTGYYNTEHLKSCEDNGYDVYVAEPDQSQVMERKGLYPKNLFIYHEESDCYHCPEGQPLRPGNRISIGKGKKGFYYVSKTEDCNHCANKAKCLSKKATRKRLTRWEHQAVADRHKTKLQNTPGLMKKRSSVVEHPFGTLKFRAGMHHFLIRGLKKCQGEFDLMALAYNFTRVLNIMGLNTLREYCVQRTKRGQLMNSMA